MTSGARSYLLSKYLVISVELVMKLLCVLCTGSLQLHQVCVFPPGSRDYRIHKFGMQCNRY